MTIRRTISSQNLKKQTDEMKFTQLKIYDDNGGPEQGGRAETFGERERSL